jgi:DegV family protein with EDD domain
MTDAACDLPAALASDLSVISVPMTVTIDGKEYTGNLNGDGIGLSAARFYELLEASSEAFTSAVNSESASECMERELKEGRDILYIAFTSALSASYNGAELAAQELRVKYPERKIFVVDSYCASLGEGLLVYLVAREKDTCLTIDKLYDFAERTKHTICHWFTVDDLKYLQRGGRVSKSVAIMGSLLNIKPVLNVDPTGHLISHSKARGVKKSLLALVDQMSESIRNATGQTVFISHSNVVDRANELADVIKQKFPTIKEVIINYIGPTIGCHTGPGCIALFYRGVRPSA